MNLSAPALRPAKLLAESLCLIAALASTSSASSSVPTAAVGPQQAGVPPAPQSARKQPAAPWAGKAALLLFLRPEQEQSRLVAETVEETLRRQPSLPVFLVVPVDATDASLSAFLRDRSWQVCSDANFECAGRLKVYVWPTTVLLDSAGVELYRAGGMPVSFVRDLSAYADLVMGSIDRDQLESRLALPDTIMDDSQEVARRHYLVAEKLLVKGLVSQAGREVEKGLRLDPNHVDLLLAQARIMLLQDRPDTAQRLLAALDRSAAPPGSVELLLGASEVALGQWDKAVEDLSEAVRLDPRHPEAFYYLGIAYQAGGAIDKAAQAFRTAFESTEEGRASFAMIARVEKTVGPGTHTPPRVK